MTSTDTQKRAPGRPRKQPIEEQRRRILDAARATFAAQDFNGASIEAIAREADVSRRVVYELFGSKEELLVAVTDDCVTRLVDRVVPVVELDDEPSPRDLIRSNIAALFVLIEHEPDVAAILRMADFGSVGSARSEVVAARRTIEAGIAQLFLLAAPTDVLSPQASRLLALVSQSFVEAVGFRQPTEPEWRVDDTIDFLTDFLLGGIYHLDRTGKLATFGETPPTG